MKIAKNIRTAAFAALVVLSAASCATTSNPKTSISYAQDASFPGTSISWGQVSWIRFDNAGNVAVLQRAQPPVTYWTAAGQLLAAWSTTQLGYPHSITFNTAGGTTSAWITDMAPPQTAGAGWGHCIKQFTTGGAPLGAIGTCGESSQGSGLNPVQFDKVTDIAFGSNVAYVTDGDVGGMNNRTLTLAMDGTLLTNWSAPNNQPGTGPKEFNLPHSVQLDDCGALWIADSMNDRVQVIQPDGTFLGQLACFTATTQPHDFALIRLEPSTVRMFVTSGAGGAATGTVSIFDIPYTCGGTPSFDCSTLVTSFTVPLPSSSSAMLHSIAVDPTTQDIYLALLASGAPPQKWVQQ